MPEAGSALRQLFDERATIPPIWSTSADNLLLDYSGVWRYRELILPVPEQYIISRPEGNTAYIRLAWKIAGQVGWVIGRSACMLVWNDSI